MDARHKVLLVLAILGLAKSISGLVGPQFMKRFSERWVVIAGKAGKPIGVLCMLIGAALWALILYKLEPVSWILLVYGVFFGWSASIYFRPGRAKSLVMTMLLERSNAFVRIISGLGVLTTALLIWVALQG